MKQIFNFLKWLVILALVFGFAFFVYVFIKINEPLKTEAPEQIFSIATGVTTEEVAQNLEGEEIISKALFFKLHVYFKKQGSKIQAGEYALSPSMSIREIAQVLTTGQAISQDTKLTVVEGWTVSDIAAALGGLGVFGEQEFLQAAATPYAQEFSFLADKPPAAGVQGYLFPDTYFLSRDETAESIVRKMLQNFDRKLTSDLREAISDQGKTIYEFVTLASIIEREVGRNVKRGEKLSSSELQKLQEERRLVASVFYNRLAIGMALESDATVTYITGSKSSRATLEETKIDSPYNTYKYRGLPPGPISNPSLDSILAAIYPAKTDYLFFLTAPDGTAYFAKTLDEHIQNRAKYLE